MPPQCIPKERRAAHLRGRLAPESLLRDLEAAEPNRPFVTLIGIKGSWTEAEDVQNVYGPAFRQEIESDPEITAQLDELRALGFEFGWGGYSDATGEEYTLHVHRNAEAEARLRSRLK